MRRSEINMHIERGIEFFEGSGFKLPPFAYYTLDDWALMRGEEGVEEIYDLKLGWDITTFGTGEFEREGLLLFTLRNGISGSVEYPKPYAEKIMMVLEGQVTPCHFHWSKREDIINRGGGNLVMEVWKAGEDDNLSDEPFSLVVDGARRGFSPGGKLVLTPGESVCFDPYSAHRFYGEPGSGPVMVGEVSSVNDDTCDNCFIEKCERFDTVEEDEPPRHLLGNDYEKLLGGER